MKVRAEDHDHAKRLFSEQRNTATVRESLQGAGLSSAQANNVCRVARKHLGVYARVRKAKKRQNQDFVEA